LLRRTVVALAASATASVAAAAGLLTAPLPAGAAPDPEGAYVVVFHDEVTDSRGASAEHRGRGVEVSAVFERAIKGYAGRMKASTAASLRSDPQVASVEVDAPVRPAAEQNTNATSPALWGLDRIDERQIDRSATYRYTQTGADVTAYVIDSGVRASHVDLSGRVGTRYDAFVGTPTDNGGVDCNGHGTHVAGTIGGEIFGVAKDVTLVGVRVLDCNGDGTISSVVGGIDWVIGHHPAGAPAVANMSLGGGASTAIDEAVSRGIADGITFVVAAGNGNAVGVAQDACRFSPARVPGAITVSATDKADRKAGFANYGACVDLFAPGVDIASAWFTADNAGNTISGTSMAAPHVAGVVAKQLQGNGALTPAQVASTLRSTATPNVVKNAKTTNPLLLFTDS
jgi:subtilisin family serine protease